MQRQALRAYTALWLLQPKWSGALVLSCGLDEAGAGFALAANIAGAVCLSIEQDAERLKAAMRSGACDFGVNTLDEALRTVKNEVRKGSPLSVGVQGNVDEVLAEVLERGVLPAVAADLRAESDEGAREALRRLQEIGAQIVDFGGRKTTEQSVDAEGLLQDWKQRLQRVLYCVGAENYSDLISVDAALRGLVTPEDRLRARWLERAPAYFRREQPLCRAIWLNESEAAELRSAGRTASD